MGEGSMGELTMGGESGILGVTPPPPAIELALISGKVVVMVEIEALLVTAG